MLHILSVVTILLAFHTNPIVSEQVCGNPVVWRNNNITCPTRAVCADVFDSQRDWLNGTTCLERRVLSNCLCAGNEVCPFNDPHHRLYASPTQSMYICEPVCRLAYCPNVQQSMDPLGANRRGSRRRDSSPVVALTTEQRAEEFSRRNYNRMSCRCPRHHYPDTQSRRGRNRSVKAFRYQYNYALRRYSTQYICNIGSRDEVRQDPCPPLTQ